MGEGAPGKQTYDRVTSSDQNSAFYPLRHKVTSVCFDFILLKTNIPPKKSG